WSVPMSGSSTVDDPATYVLWWFSTGSFTTGRCQIWAYVPAGARDADVAGAPTLFYVQRSRTDQSVVGTFAVQQAASRGSWVAGGTFARSGGAIAVRMGNRGLGSGGARHGAAQIAVQCGT